MRVIDVHIARPAFLGLLLILVAFPAIGQDKRVYTLTASDDWMPYSSAKDPEGGLLTAVAKAAFESEGSNVVITFLPWARALEDGREGRQNGIIGAWYSEEREKDFLYSDPIVENEIVLFAFKDRGIRYDKLESLSSFTIGVVRGNSFTDKLTGAGLSLDYASDFKSNFKKLVGRRIDVIADEKFAIVRLIKTEYPYLMSEIEIFQPSIESNSLYLVVSRKTEGAAKIVEEFNAGLARIREDGTMRRLFEHYGLEK